MARSMTPARQALREEIRELLRVRTRATTPQIAALINFPEGTNGDTLHSMLNYMKGQGELDYSIVDRTYSLVAGDPTPLPKVPAGTSTVTPPPPPPRVASSAPSKLTGKPGNRVVLDEDDAEELDEDEELEELEELELEPATAVVEIHVDLVLTAQNIGALGDRVGQVLKAAGVLVCAAELLELAEVEQQVCEILDGKGDDTE